MTDVKCHADNCVHWLSGMCGAETIAIDDQAGMGPESGTTLCATFLKKNGLDTQLTALDNQDWSNVAKALAGGSMSPRVACSVDTCTYWQPDNECHADIITISGARASNAQDTACDTYRPEPL